MTLDANQLPPEFETIEPQSTGELETTFREDTAVATATSLPSIPGYQSIRQLGRGGMGVVILADDLTLERKVAIKLVSHGLSGSKSLRDRFDSEVKTLASLHHPNIAQLFSAGEYGDVPYFVMEFVDGTTLDEHSKEPLNSETAAQLMVTLANAIDYCHSQGVLHRDLKPSNILMGTDHAPKIADFGLAKVLGADSSSTKTGEVLGTPGYMSPEQAGGVVKNLEPACDVYGLGAILYRLLTGRAPFVAAEPFQAVIMVLSDDPVRPRKLVPNISTDLETICLKCLEKKPANRYQSARDLQADLQRFLDGEPITAKPTGPIVKVVKWAKRNLAATIGIVATAILIIGGVAGLIIHNNSLANELARSKRLADHGSEFAKWITEEHLKSLNEVAGTTKSRTMLVEEVKSFLEDSYDDMPADPIYTSRLGASYAQLAANIGGIQQNTIGDLDEAKRSYKRAIELYDIAFPDSQSPERVLSLKAEALIDYSEIQLRLGNQKAREELLAGAEEIVRKITPSPDLSHLKLQITGRKIDTAISKNSFENALKQLVEFDQLILDIEDVEKYEVEAINQRILSARRKAVCFDSIGDSEKATACLTKAIGLNRDLVKRKPENVKYQILLSQMVTQLADVYFYEEKNDLAKPLYEEALKISEALAKKDAESADAKYALAVKLSHLGSLYQNMTLMQEAETAIKRAIKINRDLVAAGSKESYPLQGLIIDIQTLARLCFFQGNQEEADKQFEEHKSLCEAVLEKNSEDTFALNQLAEVSLFQALIGLQNLASLSEVNPETIEQSPEVKKIKSKLKSSLEFYNRIKKIMPLDAKQQSQVEQLAQIRQVTDETIQQMKALGNPADRKSEQKSDSPDY